MKTLYIKPIHMKRILLLLLLFHAATNAQIVNIPDANFKAKLLAADVTNTIAQNLGGFNMKIDANNDGNIQVSEALMVGNLDVQASEISDLTGITSFTNLQVLLAQNNSLTTLNATGMASLVVLIASANQLTSVNVAGLSNLEALSVDSNQLTSITVSGIGLSSLRGLDVRLNQLTTLNVTGMTTIENINCSNNFMPTLNVNGLTNLRALDCRGNDLTSISISAMPNFQVLNCSGNEITTMSLTGAMPLFEELDASFNQLIAVNLTPFISLKKITLFMNPITSVNLTGLVNLESLNMNSCELTTFDATSLVSLKELWIGGNDLTSLNVMGMTNLEFFQCAGGNLTQLNLDGLSGLKHLDCTSNQLTTLDVSDSLLLEHFGFSFNQLTAIDLTGLIHLKQLECHENLLTSLNVTGCSALFSLSCSNNLLTTLDLSGLANLEAIDCQGNNLTTILFAGNNALTYVNCPYNEITTLDVTGAPNLITLFCFYNSLTTLDVTNLSQLDFLQCYKNQLTSLNVSGLPLLKDVFCASNQLTTLDLTGLPQLWSLDCSDNLLTTINVNECTALFSLMAYNNQELTTVYAKNGRNESITVYDNANLAYVCVDESQVAEMQTLIQGNTPNTVVSSYCLFTPGGNFNTVTGSILLDMDNNGCDANDLPVQNVRVDIAGETITGGTFANYLGNYTLYAETGDYTLNAHLENPQYFSLTPATVDVNFPLLDSSAITQNFCLSPVGAHPDLEIVLTPIGVARPGFDAQYQIVYKNKGNQTFSGTVNLTFDDSRTDFVSATPTVDAQNPNALIWNYANLLPFETRTIDFTLNINSPVETPSVNQGDVLDFMANINFAEGDLTPLDNVFVLHQAAVNSMDPNAKTCLEGDYLTPEKIGSYLHYKIEFENLGNAEAINVVVKDEIDTTRFDINTLQVIYATHDMQTTIRGHVVEFKFANINLAPAAGDPPVGGHGTILFKIKTLPTLEVGDEASNMAHIYFDYNAPIETNVARTSFHLLSNPEFTADQSVVVYPNPVKDFVNISCDSTIQSVELYDIQGRLLETMVDRKKQIRFDLTKQSNGLYFIRISTEKGKRIEKITKE